MADGDQMERILLSLLTNAFTFVPQDGALFQVVMPWQRPAADTPLVTSPSSTTAWQVRQQVVTLGKPTARLARGNGRLGRIRVESEVGQGFTFTATVPLQQPQEDRAA